MDYYLCRTLLYAGVSLCIVGCGLWLVDYAIKSQLRMRKRLALYAGVAMAIVGLLPVCGQLLANEEWKLIKTSADYHDTVTYHRERRNRALKMKEELQDAGRSTGVAPVVPSSDKQPSF